MKFTLPIVTIAMITPISSQPSKTKVSEPLPSQGSKFDEVPKVLEEDDRELKGVKVKFL